MSVGENVQSFTHLRNTVAMHVDDPDHVLDELLPKHWQIAMKNERKFHSQSSNTIELF